VILSRESGRSGRDKGEGREMRSRWHDADVGEKRRNAADVDLCVLQERRKEKFRECACL
jgi:hypothetical protein